MDKEWSLVFQDKSKNGSGVTDYQSNEKNTRRGDELLLVPHDFDGDFLELPIKIRIPSHDPSRTILLYLTKKQ